MKNNRLFTLLALMMFFAAGCTKPVEPNNGGDNNGVAAHSHKWQ